MEDSEYVEKQNYYLSSLKSLVADLKASVDRIIIWKEEISTKLTIMTESLKYDDIRHINEKSDYLIILGKVQVLEKMVSDINVNSSREYFKSNTTWDVIKYILVAGACIGGTYISEILRKR